MSSREKISASVSLDGAKELYLIIVGIGITEALMHTVKFQNAQEFISYFVLLIGYLLTVLRFSLGTINMMGHMAGKVNLHWTKVISLVTLAFLAMGLCFFWMGMHLQHIVLFILFTLLLVLCDWITLFISHRPWSPPRGWGLWMANKSVAIALGYPLGWYDPHRDTKHYHHALTEDQKLIKATHYQWLRSSFWLGVVFFVLLWHWLGESPSLWDHYPTLDRMLHNRPAYEFLMGGMLILFAIWDFSVNRAYYFGEEDEEKPDLNF